MKWYDFIVIYGVLLMIHNMTLIALEYQPDIYGFAGSVTALVTLPVAIIWCGEGMRRRANRKNAPKP